MIPSNVQKAESLIKEIDAALLAVLEPKDEKYVPFNFYAKFQQLLSITGVKDSLESEINKYFADGGFPTLSSPRHKIVLLHELGILKHLRNTNPDLNNQNFAKLVCLVTGLTEQAQANTISKEINVLLYNEKASGKGGSPVTENSVNSVKSALAKIGISVKNLPGL